MESKLWPALVMAGLGWACGDTERPGPPPVRLCDGSPCTDPVVDASGDGRATCDPLLHPQGSAVVSGSVLVLDNENLPLEASDLTTYAELQPFAGRARVDIDSGGCDLASIETGAEGGYRVQGVRKGTKTNYTRITPLESSDLMLTVSVIPTEKVVGGDVTGLRSPILTRRALTAIFARLPSPPAIDDDKGHLIVKIADMDSKRPLAGATISGLGGTRGYDGDNQTGGSGLAFYLNVTAPDYPGSERTVTINGPSNSVITIKENVLLAKGAVSLLVIRMSGL
jgi:hypothetical protein